MFRPSLPEQRAIAAVLDAWSCAITQTGQLIEAKRRLEDGVLQQVLTGRRRLPGFRTEWRWPQANRLFRERSVRNRPGEVLLSVTQEHGVVPRASLDTRVTMPNGDRRGFKLVEPGDFVISLRSFQGGIEHSEHRGIVSPAYTVLVRRQEICDRYYRHYLKSADFVRRLSVAVVGIRDGKQVSYDDFCMVRIPQPPGEEQKAIASIADIADREVGLLDAKREAIHRQKQALMQKLLAGQVRVRGDGPFS